MELSPQGPYRMAPARMHCPVAPSAASAAGTGHAAWGKTTATASPIVRDLSRVLRLPPSAPHGPPARVISSALHCGQGTSAPTVPSIVRSDSTRCAIRPAGIPSARARAVSVCRVPHRLAPLPHLPLRQPASHGRRSAPHTPPETPAPQSVPRADKPVPRLAAFPPPPGMG